MPTAAAAAAPVEAKPSRFTQEKRPKEWLQCFRVGANESLCRRMMLQGLQADTSRTTAARCLWKRPDQRASKCNMRFVLFLYMTRWPHSRHRMGSLGRISLVAAQSAQMYSMTGLRVARPPMPAPPLGADPAGRAWYDIISSILAVMCASTCGCRRPEGVRALEVVATRGG